jgi:hypothetical protein
MLTDEERRVVAMAAWKFRVSAQLPAEVLCRHLGSEPRDLDGGPTVDYLRAWARIAAALDATPTGFLRLLQLDPVEVARRLLAPLGDSPESLGWVSVEESAG